MPRNPWDIALDDMVALDDEVVLLTTGTRGAGPKLLIGRSTYVNRFTMFDASLNISIGAECMIGPYCYITDHDHGAGDGPISAQALVEAPVKVGNNVWIGAHAVILKGVSIGDNAIIGAGAVVTTDVGPGERVAGVPARQIGSWKAGRGRAVFCRLGPQPRPGLRGALSVDATGIDRGRESACRRRHPHLQPGNRGRLRSGKSPRVRPAAGRNLGSHRSKRWGAGAASHGAFSRCSHLDLGWQAWSGRWTPPLPLACGGGGSGWWTPPLPAGVRRPVCREP